MVSEDCSGSGSCDTGMGAEDGAAPQWEQQPRSDGFHTHTHCFWKSLLAVRVPTDLRSLRYHNQPSTSSGSVLSEVAGAKALLSAIPVVTDPGTEQGLKPL